MSRRGAMQTARILLFLMALTGVLFTTGCDGNVYMGVSVAGPYSGYPYGYGGGYRGYGGGVYVGRPFP